MSVLQIELCHKLYDFLRKYKDADNRTVCDFLVRAPSRRLLPQYYEVVSSPIDLMKIQVPSFCVNGCCYVVYYVVFNSLVCRWMRLTFLQRIETPACVETALYSYYMYTCTWPKGLPAGYNSTLSICFQTHTCTCCTTRTRHRSIIKLGFPLRVFLHGAPLWYVGLQPIHLFLIDVI